MSWTLLSALVLALGLALLVAVQRRRELLRMARRVRERERAVRPGSEGAQLQFPVVDLSRCLGCATCVAVCPEDGVIDIVHGQAVVVFRSTPDEAAVGDSITVRSHTGDLLGVGTIHNLLARGRTLTVQPSMVLGSSP